MAYEVRLTKEIEALARELGASYEMVKKWRSRGISPRWQLKLLGAMDLREPRPSPQVLNESAE